MDFVNFLQLHSRVGLIILTLMAVLWLISLLLKDSSIVDIFWGTGFVISAWTAFLLTTSTLTPRHWLIAILTTIWGLRLSTHIFLRNMGRGEDFRYAKWRAENGKSWWWKSFFKVFLTQGILMWIIASPLTASQLPGQPDKLIWLDFVAILVWAIGFFFEAMGDLQLTRFRANPANKGKLLNYGVWRYTRHPNYFGDSAQWWGYYLVALTAGAWWVIFSPLIMTYLLVNVSGVALLEKSMKAEKPGYKEYMETTNAFVPWFPKKKS
ncbi:MAG TPA: DUF1295 domain-containing protein [Anaerolineaceae bacterium]|jgi:steroid 5-alpha reductase family enzyme|nr:DUF1295 domain-containing protein [Anaerolineaceae bacterium]